jgi:hypothetical protein
MSPRHGGGLSRAKSHVLALQPIFEPRQLMTELAKQRRVGRVRRLMPFAADCHYREGTRAP